MKYKLPVILFFIASETPTDEEYAEAQELKAIIRFRNVSLFDERDAVETFDDVAGMVPEKYLEAKAEKEKEAAEAQAKAERNAALAAEAAEKAAKSGKKGSGATGAAPTNSPAPAAAPGGGSGPPADWKPA